jgi:hypothetical protein
MGESSEAEAKSTHSIGGRAYLVNMKKKLRRVIRTS